MVFRSNLRYMHTMRNLHPEGRTGGVDWAGVPIVETDLDPIAANPRNFISEGATEIELAVTHSQRPLVNRPLSEGSFLTALMTVLWTLSSKWGGQLTQ